MASVNPLRGEATVRIAGGEYKLAATMEGLAQLSAATECRTLGDLYDRLINCELSMARAALRAFVLSGTVDGQELKRQEAVTYAVLSFSLTDVNPASEAFARILTALTRDVPSASEDSDSGNRQAPTA